MVQKPALSLSLDQDPFPCGAALQAVRSPRCNTPAPLDTCGSGGSLSSEPTVSGDDAAGAGDNNSDGTRSALPRKSVGKPAIDLARRSQQRVIDRKRTELEHRQEEETKRRVRVERDKQERDQAARLKLRRRAEIYALNAILRELQQRKIAEYIAAQQQQEQEQSSGDQDEQNMCLAVQAIGV